MQLTGIRRRLLSALPKRTLSLGGECLYEVHNRTDAEHADTVRAKSQPAFLYYSATPLVGTTYEDRRNGKRFTSSSAHH